MVVLKSRKPKKRLLRAKLDNLLHDHHKPEPEPEPGLAPLQAFRAEISDGVQRLIADSKELSFTWVEKGLKLLDGINKAFVKLIESVDCPINKWEQSLVEEYLCYTSEILDRLNSMSSSLAHLQSVRLSLAHALGSGPSTTSGKRLLQSNRKWAVEEGSGGQFGKPLSLNGKQGIVLQGVVEMKGVGLWVCGVIVCGLGGEVPLLVGSDSEVPLLVGVDSRVCVGVLKEVKEVVDCVLVNGNGRGEEFKEMGRKVERFQRKLEEVVEEVNCLFSQFLASRNRLMDCFRLHNE